jgi:hypothetical protein
VLGEARRHSTRPRREVEADIRKRLEQPTTPSGEGRFGRRKVTDRPTDRRNDNIAPPAQPGGPSGKSRHDYPGASQ